MRAVAHHHILILAVDPARKRNVPRNRIAQRRQALGQAVKALGTGDLTQGVRGAAPPIVLGELALAGGATDEVVAQRAFQGRMAQKYRQLAPALDDIKTGQFRMALFMGDFRRPGIDVGAFADHPGQKVVVGQLGVGVGNGLARNAQLLRQQSAGRKLRPGCQAAGFDGTAQLLVQLACQVLAAVDDNM
ncbi:hypothetical protein D3C87_1646080 [compost metagenome]